MTTAFAKPVNDLATTTTGHAGGATTLALAAGAGALMGPLPPGRIFRVTALQDPDTESEVILGVFEATGISGDTLTGVSGAEGYANVDLPAGAGIQIRMTAKDYEDHSAAINAAEAAIAALTPPSGSLTATQIQALIDADAAAGRATVLPAATHTLDRPLRISRWNTTLLGDPGGGTTLSTARAGGMPTIFIAPVLATPPVLFDGQFSRWVNLRDTIGGDVDGLATLSIAFDLDLASASTAGEDRVIVSSGGARGNFGEYTESLRLSVLDGSLHGKLTTATTGQVTLTTPIAAGPHHVELIYDGSTLALHVDGAGPSTAATGAVSQGFYEDFCIGTDLARWPDAVSLSHPVTGTMTNFVLTGPGTGPALISIPSFVPGVYPADQQIACDTAAGPATLLLKQDGNISGIQYVRVADLTIEAQRGHGIFTSEMQASILERLTLSGRQPLTMWNNSYLNSIRDLNLKATGLDARYGVAMISGVTNEVQNIQVGGGNVGIVANSAGGSFDNCYVFGGNMKVGFLAKQDGGFQRWSNSVVTDENQLIPGDASLMFSGFEAVLVDGGGSYATSATHPLIILDHCTGATILGHQLFGSAGTAAAATVTACGAVVAQSSPITPGTVPYGAGVTVLPGAGGGVAIGAAISGGTAGRILFEGAGPVLADDANFRWDGSGRILAMPDGFAIGSGAFASATNGVAIGFDCTASGAQSVAVGLFATANQSNAVAVGPLAAATGAAAIAIGVSAFASTVSGIAIGNTATCNQVASAALGGGVTLAADELAWGNQTSPEVPAHFRLTGFSTVQPRSLCYLRTAWIDPTDASFLARADFNVNDFNAPIAGRTAWSGWSDGGNGRFAAAAPPSAPVDARIGTSQVSFHVDEAGNALKFRVRYSDGTTLKSGSIALT